MTKVDDAELAVRNYLLFLEDPDHLVDRDRLQALEEQVARANDPIERLRLFAEIEAIRNPIEAPYRSAFIEHAQRWAASNGVTAPAFQRMGVPKNVLDAAGLRAPTRQPGTSRVLARAEMSSSRRSVATSEVVAAVLRERDHFSLPSLQAATGASPMTVRKALGELIEQGKVERLGPDPAWNSPGRAPILYKLRKAS